MFPEKIFQYVAIAGLLQSFVLSALLLTRKQHRKANALLSALVVISSVQALLNAFDNRNFFLAYPHLSKISWLLPSLFGPLIYLFTVKLTGNDKKRNYGELIHFVPFLIYLIILFPYFTKSTQYKIDYLSNFEVASKDDFGILTQLSIPLIFIYLVAAWIHLNRYKTKLLISFSQIEKIKLQWLRQFVMIVLIILVITAVAFYAEKFKVPYVSWLYHYTYFLVVFFIYWIGYKTLSQPEIFLRTAETIESIPVQPDTALPKLKKEEWGSQVKYQKTQLSPEQKSAYKDELCTFMETKKAYLQPELTILDLAQQTGIPRHIISQVINDELGKNFYDFVNGYRIEEFKRNIVNPEFSHLNLLAVALESGFNSKATFNSAFKKITGITPSQYVKSTAILV